MTQTNRRIRAKDGAGEPEGNTRGAPPTVNRHACRRLMFNSGRSSSRPIYLKRSWGILGPLRGHLGIGASARAVTHDAVSDIMGRMANPTLETLLQTANECHAFLDTAGIPHVVIGGLAVCLYRGKPTSRDVDLLVRRDDWDRIRQLFGSARFVWNAFRNSYRSPTNVRVDFRYAGETVGDSGLRLPDPGTDQFRNNIDGLPVLALANLIESKLACAIQGGGERQRKGRHRKGQSQDKHSADVVSLIAVNNLVSSYSDHLHESVRAEFRRLVAQAGGS